MFVQSCYSIRGDTETKTLIDGKIESLKKELEELEEEKRKKTTDTTSRGRTSIRTSRLVNNDEVEKLNDSIGDKKQTLRVEKKNLKESRENLKVSETIHRKWEERFPYRNREALLAHGRKIVDPVNDYYHNLFLVESGDNYNVRQCAKACLIFDPLYLKDKENELAMLSLLADNLKHFQCKEFNGMFISALKNEIKHVVHLANQPFDWENIDHTNTYQTRMQRRIKRYKLNDGETFDWRDDPGERSCKIWAWWRARILIHEPNIVHFKTALRLVVLTQLSSCAVERVFSRLERIRHTCGDNLYEDITEIRVLMRCNGDLGGLKDA